MTDLPSDKTPTENKVAPPNGFWVNGVDLKESPDVSNPHLYGEDAGSLFEKRYPGAFGRPPQTITGR